MRSPLLLLFLLLAVAAVAWFALAGADEGEREATSDRLEADSGAQTPAAKDDPGDDLLSVDRSGARVLDEVPPGGIVRDESAEREGSTLEDPEVLEIRVQVPDARERIDGDIVLRALSRALGAERPFWFADAGALAAFRSAEFEGFPPGEANVADLLALAPRAGFEFFERDGRFYMMRLPDEGD